jgi:putative membrane protein
VLLAALIATLHYLTLALGFGSVLVRGVRLRDLRRDPRADGLIAGLFGADAAWGVAAALWIATGLVRAFGRLEKAPVFYLRNGFFLVKMGLFVSVVAIEIFPMVTFIRWRIASQKGGAPWQTAPLGRLIWINDAEVAAVMLIVFAATLMSRGIWLF